MHTSLAEKMIFLHGALGSASQADWLRPHLPTGFSLEALHLPGHGGLLADRPFLLSLFADAVWAFLPQKEGSPVQLFGYSMGGYVAVWMAAQYPERVHKVLTLNTKWDWTPETALRMSGMFEPEKVEAKAPQLAAAWASAHAPTDWKQVAARTADFLHVLGQGAGLQEADLGRVQCPVLLLRGAADPTVSTAETRQVADALPQGRMEEVPNSRHALEQVDGVAVVAAMKAHFFLPAV